MTDLSTHKKNISTYTCCENLIKDAIRDLYVAKAKRVRIDGDCDKILEIYYGHLERIKQLETDYLTRNNLKIKDD